MEELTHASRQTHLLRLQLGTGHSRGCMLCREGRALVVHRIVEDIVEDIVVDGAEVRATARRRACQQNGS